jgi:dienelactone hydrolase
LGFLTCGFKWRWGPLLAVLATASALLNGCAAPSPQERSARAVAWAAGQGWQARVLPGPDFDIQAFVPIALQAAQRLTVYIEGDGLAWVDRQTPSFAPTPSDPTGLRLAVADAGGRSVYLGRPCQYTQGPAFEGCHPRYWGSHRFAPEVIAAMDHAVEQLRRAYGASELVLVGYSGGAAVAALLASSRTDVMALVTVAGTLDTWRWTQQQNLSPLQGSLNPKDAAPRLRQLPQWHFAGERDEVVPNGVLASFLQGLSDRREADTPGPMVEMVPDFDHHCCWAQAWPALSRRFALPAVRN